LISIACLPPDVPTARGRREIVRAAQMAADRGVAVVGLGALTAPATGGGAGLIDRLPSGVAVTNGNAYTAAVLRQNVMEVNTALALDRPARVAVVGWTGSVGTAVSRLLARGDLDLILIGRQAARARKLLGECAPAARFSDDLADVALADMVLLLTNSPSAKVTPDVLRRNSVV